MARLSSSSQKHLPHDVVMAIFDRNGTVIAANRSDVANAGFRPPNARRSQRQTTMHSATDDHGRTWTFATAKLLGNSVLVGFAMREVQPVRAHLCPCGHRFPAADRDDPAGLGGDLDRHRAANHALDRLSEARGAGLFAAAITRFRPALDDAPSEFKRLGDDLADMAGSIEDRDRRLREAVEQKTLLIREIHHRVKNNLQIVMSLLSLQAGRLKDQASQDALKRARMRINALALVHRILHEIEDQTTRRSEAAAGGS